MFFLVVIAHGDEGDILLSADRKKSVTVSEIIQKMDSMEDLRGRPKVLIVESCRGKSFNKGLKVSNKQFFLNPIYIIFVKPLIKNPIAPIIFQGLLRMLQFILYADADVKFYPNQTQTNQTNPNLI
jgi:hypothetical protein